MFIVSNKLLYYSFIKQLKISKPGTFSLSDHELVLMSFEIERLLELNNSNFSGNKNDLFYKPFSPKNASSVKLFQDRFNKF